MSGQKKPLEIVVVVFKESVANADVVVETLEEGLRAVSRSLDTPVAKLRVVDPREPPVPSVVCIHVGFPYPVWFPWAKVQ